MRDLSNRIGFGEVEWRWKKGEKSEIAGFLEGPEDG